MDVASVSDACLSLNHVYDATVEWNQEEINDDCEVHIACESVQTICQGILSTMDELLTVDMNEDNHNGSQDENEDGSCQLYYLIWS